MDYIDIHADDYAISLHASENLIERVKAGKLDSISIIPNMSCFGSCMGRLLEEWNNFPKKPLISVHINLMEGHCLSRVETVPDLVDSEGYFKISWGSLLLASYNPMRYNRIKHQLQIEIQAQIERIRNAEPAECELRLDSHQHTHMIPIVFDAMMTVVRKQQHPVTFIRVAREPIMPFLTQISLYSSYSVTNIVKNVILNLYAGNVERKLRAMKIEPALLWGLVMTGHMDVDRVKKLYPSMLRICERKNKKMELLFHPGCVLAEEINEEYVKKGFVEFHLSEGRKIERHAVDNLAQEVMHEQE